IIPLSNEERKRLDESYKAYILGLIFNLFEIDIETEKISGEKKAVYKYTMQDGITVRRTEQLGIEARLINRLYEEENFDSLRLKILKQAENIKNKLTAKGCLAELLLIFEYYYENIYKPDEILISGEAKRKVETYQYKIVRELAQETENIIPGDMKEEYIRNINKLKNNYDSFSYLCGDGSKRTLKVNELLDMPVREKGNEKTTDGKSKFNIEELKKLKQALDENLITKEEFETAKKRILNI
ncbi:MAG: SHOCT domain-containing protein, partial [Ignavibacteria bacterium]|nr:SHOCT domain-containing protein [Ignavibacteria bacterium]